MIILTSRCIGRKTEARGGKGEIPAAARGDGMMGGGTPDHHHYDYCDEDDVDDGGNDDGFDDDEADLEQLLSGVCVGEQRTGKAALLIKSWSSLGRGTPSFSSSLSFSSTS